MCVWGGFGRVRVCVGVSLLQSVYVKFKSPLVAQ